jgi:mono/diheme cytochrome c family protein
MLRCHAPFLLLSLLTVATAFAAAAPTAAQNYEKHCAGCHGTDGKGQTRLGRKSGAKNLTDKAGAGKLTDAELFRTIQAGRRDDQGRERMEGFGNDLSAAEITDLVAYVRRFTK